MLKHAWWMLPWLGGLTIIGLLGRYGVGEHKVIPEWWDLATVIVFSLVIFYLAVNLAQPRDMVMAAIDRDAELALEEEHELGAIG